jgi:uncharacterized protein YndB with AHSA1/START domain
MAARDASKPSAPGPLTVRRTFTSPPDRVFRAWTSAEELKRWHSPGEVTLAEVDLRVGGRYRVHMRAPDGKEHRVVGVYRTIDAPRMVSYTWQWEGDPNESLVTVEFLPKGTGTELVLTHSGFPDADTRTHHEHGWNALVAKLSTVVS